ncbi:MAG: hypothetical protein A2091_01370 [Desulfuromonadales bacterium GWD2_61_12]|nr:MAG: hypothetical protein A2005_09795 [Desulfuromonadales bacterium GWC2_61_20]OGR33950.1 MAG: hypothetical protein A2091_01370 [Desulfuromonadales bacterium GWD2_61_12]HAD05145.1 hypothetical protein [Desulfuromonas sp.]HBT82726.1 hypothetical protein [Desulfuromonas sp.]
MILQRIKTGLLFAALAALFGCSEPPVPPEVQLATSQEQDLWGAGASIYAPDEYQQYLSSLNAAKDILAREQACMAVLRNYSAVAALCQDVLKQGELIDIKIATARSVEATEIARAQLSVQKKIRMVRELVENAQDKRLAVRKLVQAEVRAAEAKKMASLGRGADARKRLDEAEKDLAAVVKVIRPLIQRYADRGQVSSWRRLADDAIAESRRNGSEVILVNKVDRQLTLFRNGTAVRSFSAGLGFNYLADKLYSGDRATPEGRYQIVRKIDRSRYYRALELDYPNQEDQRRFAQAKRAGLVPKNSDIGNKIQIHGGGRSGMTYGCVSLDNPAMEYLFAEVAIGTPVIIVGTVDHDNFLSSAVRNLN